MLNNNSAFNITQFNDLVILVTVPIREPHSSLSISRAHYKSYPIVFFFKKKGNSSVNTCEK